MDIFSYESAHRIGEHNILRKVDALLDWAELCPKVGDGVIRRHFEVA